MALHQYERAVLKAAKNGAYDVSTVQAKTGLKKDAVLKAVQWLAEKKALRIKEEKKTEFKLEAEGRDFLENGFPETRLTKKAAEKNLAFTELSADEKRFGISWAKKLGWIIIMPTDSGKVIEATPEGKKAVKGEYAPMKLLRKVAEGRASEADQKELVGLSKRGNLVSFTEEVTVTFNLTPEGSKLAGEQGEMVQELNQLNKSQIVTGEWKKARLREYNIKAPSERAYPGKKHPLRQVIDRIRGIFLEMGFEEMKGNMVESSFWNFDALFQPQDHPARELADTFYLLKPDTMEIPDPELEKRVRETHEKGWKYQWKKEIAKQPVLRTHTTAVSARYLAETGSKKRKAPAKYFLIGKVYRNETVDFKHLAEFQQVDGIIVDENATFADLLGIIKEFYKKLGFEKIRFRPSYFPYTEPSLEIEVYYEERGEWMELGGAGIFRPEVCIPLWGKYPVLAWGLSLERPVMLSMGINDIRTFYRNDLSWLRDTKVGKEWI